MSTQNQTHETNAVTMRLAGPADVAALRRLAAVDSKPAPAGDVLVAEVDARIVAAVPVDGGPAVADPFKPTAHLVSLLRSRAGQLATPLRRSQRRAFGARLHAA